MTALLRLAVPNKGRLQDPAAGLLSQAGLGIAYCAKPRVKERADASLSGGMLGILYLLGITEQDLSEIETDVLSPRTSNRTREDAAP